MTNDLVTLDFEQMALMTGANIREPSIILPRLKINRDAEEGPVGTFMVSTNDDPPQSLFEKTVKFRPFFNAFQYMEYDAEVNTFPNKSLIIKSFNEEALDELGGLRCGKVAFKDLEALPPEEKAHQRNIKCYRYVYGTVEFNSEVSALPVVWKMAGVNFRAPQTALDTITKMRHQYFNHNLELSLERQKKGSNTYYLVHVNLDAANVLSFDDTDMATFKTFQEIIDRENRFVLLKYKEAKKAQFISNDDIDVAEALNLNDELPFELAQGNN